MQIAYGACNACGREGMSDFGVKNGYPVGVCGSCGFIQVQTSGGPPIDGFYEEDYFEGKSAFGFGSPDAASADITAGPLEPPYEWVMRRYLDPLEPKSILEIGPGSGGGWIRRFLGDPTRSLQCIEISRFASNRLNEAGLPTFCGTVEGYEAGTQFDAVLAIEVIEHVPDPVAFADAVSRLVAPSGVLLLSTGNARSATARKLGIDWYYIDPPAHLSFFNDKNIVTLLEKAGFRSVRVLRYGFKWIEVALRYRGTAALPMVSALNYASGMVAIARK